MKKLTKYGKLNKKYKEALSLIDRLTEANSSHVKTRDEVVEALFGEDSYGSKTREQIVERIGELKGEAKAGERFLERIEGTERPIVQENARLWYLVRAISKDPTLTNEVVNHIEEDPSSYRISQSPFRKPRF